jgi:hypothetical protein
MSDTQVRNIGEDCAYSFKGLYKQSDWMEKSIRIYVFAPLLSSILFLVAPTLAQSTFGTMLSVITLIFSIIMLTKRNQTESIVGYRDLANQFKEIYEQAELMYHSKNYDNEQIKKLVEKKSELNTNTSRFPISGIARIWSKLVIKHEMNIDWLKKTT